MDVEEVEKQQEKTNEENDAREEDIVKDTDADTRETDDSINRVMKKLDLLFDEIDSLKGGVKALQNAQAMLVENGHERYVMDVTQNIINLITKDEIYNVVSYKKGY